MKELQENIKLFYYVHTREIVLVVVTFFVASLSFGLGYLSNREFNHAPIIIEKCSRVLDATATTGK